MGKEHPLTPIITIFLLVGLAWALCLSVSLRPAVFQFSNLKLVGCPTFFCLVISPRRVNRVICVRAPWIGSIGQRASSWPRWSFYSKSNSSKLMARPPQWIPVIYCIEETLLNHALLLLVSFLSHLNYHVAKTLSVWLPSRTASRKDRLRKRFKPTCWPWFISQINSLGFIIIYLGSSGRGHSKFWCASNNPDSSSSPQIQKCWISNHTKSITEDLPEKVMDVNHNHTKDDSKNRTKKKTNRIRALTSRTWKPDRAGVNKRNPSPETKVFSFALLTLCSSDDDYFLRRHQWR